MDEMPNMSPWRLTIPEGLYAELKGHLFPGDGDEHGAVMLAGVCESDRGLRLVARELHLAKDRLDYVPGKRGYRMLKAEFIQSKILRARDRRLAYLAIHNHGGTDSVGFSEPDMASHERGYPALLDIARGMPVGALVLAPVCHGRRLVVSGLQPRIARPRGRHRAPATAVVPEAEDWGCCRGNVRPTKPTVR